MIKSLSKRKFVWLQTKEKGEWLSLQTLMGSLTIIDTIQIPFLKDERLFQAN